MDTLECCLHVLWYGCLSGIMSTSQKGREGIVSVAYAFIKYLMSKESFINLAVIFKGTLLLGFIILFC